MLERFFILFVFFFFLRFFSLFPLAGGRSPVHLTTLRDDLLPHDRSIVGSSKTVVIPLTMFILRMVLQRRPFRRRLEILPARFAYYRLCGLVLRSERSERQRALASIGQEELAAASTSRI